MQLSGRVIRKALMALRVRSKRRRTPFWPDLAQQTQTPSLRVQVLPIIGLWVPKAIRTTWTLMSGLFASRLVQSPEGLSTRTPLMTTLPCIAQKTQRDHLESTNPKPKTI